VVAVTIDAKARKVDIAGRYDASVIVYDPADPRWAVDPGPLFDELREQNPIHKTPANYWVLARHADCLSLLRDKVGSADSRNLHRGKVPGGFSSPEDELALELIRATGEDTRPFLVRDPPDHERLRGLVARAFTPRRIAELTPYVTELAEGYVRAHLDGQPFDAVAELAWPLPVAVIGEMLGVPEADFDAFKEQSALVARGLDPDFLLDDATRKQRDDAGLFFIDYFSRLFAQRRAHPGDDLLSALVVARDGEDRLSEGELISTAILLLVAGHETTMNLVSGSLLLLSRDRDVQDALRQNGVDRRAIDELMRLVSPVQWTARILTEDRAFGDTVIEAGYLVITLLAAANRDPAVFADPTVLTLDRDPNPQLGFGFGLHHCLGAPLARLEAEVLLGTILALTRSFTVTGPVAYRPNIVLRGLAELELVFEE
jgi:cytochrome P450